MLLLGQLQPWPVPFAKGCCLGELQVLTGYHSGLALAAGCVVTCLLCQQGRRRAFRVSLAITLLLLPVAAHLGGWITHAREFVNRYVPTNTPEMSGKPINREKPIAGSAPAMEQPVFTGLIEPILQKHCTECHGASKQKAQLRLDTFEDLLKGGQNGPVMKAGSPQESPLVQTMVSALDADGHMPPDEEPQPNDEEIKLVQWWVNIGAPISVKPGDLQLEPEMRRLLGALLERHQAAP